MRNNLDRTGKIVSFTYRGGIEGKPPEDTTGDTPRRIELGAGSVPTGIENALYEMEVGEMRTVVLEPELGFGAYDERAVQTIMRDFVPNGHSLKEGSIIGWKDPRSGYMMPVRVTKATEDYVTLDHNHPFAGKTVCYELHLVEIE